MYEGWKDDVLRARDNWHVVTDESTDLFERLREAGDVAHGKPVRFVEAEARTGSRCIVVTTPLGKWGRQASGGSVMVAVQYPWPGAYPLQYGGTLHSTYVLEKFVHPVNRKPHMGDVTLLLMTIAHALDREAVVDGFDD